MVTKELHLWDLWIADAGATGISFARGRLDPTDVMIVHAPKMVECSQSTGMALAIGVL